MTEEVSVVGAVVGASANETDRMNAVLLTASAAAVNRDGRAIMCRYFLPGSAL